MLELFRRWNQKNQGLNLANVEKEGLGPAWTLWSPLHPVWILPEDQWDGRTGALSSKQRQG